MKEIYSSGQLIDVELRKTFLENAGIKVTVLGAGVRAASGEVPVGSCRLMLLSDADLERAGTLLNEFDAGSRGPKIPWVCPKCGEKCEAQFDSCWKCGSSRER